MGVKVRDTGRDLMAASMVISSKGHIAFVKK